MTQTNIEQDKIDFEACNNDAGIYSLQDLDFNKDINGRYKNLYTVYAWKSWQAALKLERERQVGEAVAKIVKNSTGQISLQDDKVDMFDISKFVGTDLFTAP